MKNQEVAVPVARRHDLDALRAGAMLLGIALHAGMSLTGFPWIVQDTRTNPVFILLLLLIHDFRMQLFMLVSGYFTMMVYRKRGLKPLLRQRFMRIGIPLMVSMVTLIPLLQLTSAWAIARGAKADSQKATGIEGTVSFREVIVNNDLESLKRMFEAGSDINQPDAKYQLTPLHWAALTGNTEAARELIDRGADVSIRTRDGYTPVHHAAFLGHPEVLRLLIDRGSDPAALSPKQETALDVAATPEATTSSIAGMLQLKIPDAETLQKGRQECIAILMEKGVAGKVAAAEMKSKGGLDQIRRDYAAFLSSGRFQTDWNYYGKRLHLIETQVFGHLWFLWFLCFFVGFFAVFTQLLKFRPIDAMFRRLCLSAYRFWILVALTMLPQMLMGTAIPNFGPDTSTGIIPQPHLLAYYFVFFLFGAVYFQWQEEAPPLGQKWRVMLPAGLLILLPVGLATMRNPVIGGLFQVLYSWCMVFGLIGLFEAKVGNENPYFRYLSDASYWLYLAHMPVVIVLQAVLRSSEMPSYTKFLIITNVTVLLLLVVYQLLVRYTLIGRILNGPLKQAQAKSASA
ncbi:MAG: Glucans biosynthesis protein [Planctomycetota bacterium]